MNLLDWALLLMAVLAARVGWRVGLICGLTSLLAVVMGGALGFGVARALLAPPQFATTQQTLILAAATIAGILAAQLITTQPAQRVHDAVMATPARHLNNFGGAGLTLGFGVISIWMLATAFALSPSTQLTSMMRGSAVLGGMDRAVPVDAGGLFSHLESVGLDAPPRVFTGLGLLPLPEVPLPAPHEVSSQVRRTAQDSVVRVMGHAICGRTLAGSGVVIGEDLVLTNAHVVAGIAGPLVFGWDRRIGLESVPVLFDPVRDTALLRVPGLHRSPVALAPDPQTSELVAVAGYPNAGPQQVNAGRVRGLAQATGFDIYGQGRAQREVLVFAGDVIPGDSGGPLLTQDGRMAGLIFASALGSAEHTGYALSASEVAQVIVAGGATERVGTGPCVPEA